jgi:serine/threonine-protein kinase
MLLGRGQTAPELESATPLYRHGRYRAFAELARGGMSVVYLAYVAAEAKLTGPVDLLALKELRPELAADPYVLAMFVDEGRLAARLHHPNIVRTVECGDEGGRQYIAMEYLEGPSLQRVLSRLRSSGVPLQLDFVGAVLCNVLQGLVHAHTATGHDGAALGIVHRDMSPHNVIVGFDGRVKVLDFGIATSTQSGVETRTGILKGKVPYMSPEQAAGTNVDARSDVFSVGVMLWEAVVGQRFWAGTSSVSEILQSLWQGKRAPELEDALDRAPSVMRPVIARSVEMDPSRRYSTAQEMLEDLHAALLVCGAAPFGPSDVARVMCHRFGDDRARLRAAVDEALATHRRTSGEYAVSSLVAPSPDSIGPSSGRQPIHKPTSEPKTSAPAAAAATLERVEEAPRSRTDRPAIEPVPDTVRPVAVAEVDPAPVAPAAFFWSTAIKLGGAAVAGAALAIVFSPSPTRPPQSPTLASAFSSPPGAASPAPPAPEHAARDVVHLTVRATPVQARVLIDHTVFDNPCIATMPRDGAAHTAHVEADGYLAEDHAFPANADTAIIVSLQRKPPHDSTPPPALP